MRIERAGVRASAIKAYADQSLTLSGHPSKSHPHGVRNLKRDRDSSQDPTEFSRALDRAMEHGPNRQR